MLHCHASLIRSTLVFAMQATIHHQSLSSAKDLMNYSNSFYEVVEEEGAHFAASSWETFVEMVTMDYQHESSSVDDSHHYPEVTTLVFHHGSSSVDEHYSDSLHSSRYYE
jgi:hypothetical protein